MKKVKILLCSISKNNFYDNTKSMFLYLIKHTNFDVKYVVNDKERCAELNKKYSNYFISLKTREGKKFLKDADFWLLDGGMPTKNILYMRNKKIINFWHGVPLKKIAIHAHHGIDKIRMFLQLTIFQYFITAYVTTSKNIVEVMASSFLLPKSKVKVLGQPRNENIHNPIKKEEFLKFYNDIEFGNKFILYAPTWRKSQYGASFKEEVSFFPFKEMDIQDFDRFLRENNLTIFLRPHPLEKLNFKESKNIKILSVEKLESINDYLNVFDLLIADYSGIYIDYLLLDKPIMFLAYDVEKYESIRGFNFDYSYVSPGPKPVNYQDFKDEILMLLNDENYFRKERLRVNDFFNEIKSNPCARNLEYIKSIIEKSI